MAKLSEMSIRQEKVGKLKTKILTDIDNRLDECKEVDIRNLSDELFQDYLNYGFALLKLGEYIENKYTFMLYTAIDEKADYISYVITDENIDIWLQDNYNFISNYLYDVEEHDFDVFAILNESYFAYEFTSYFDTLSYRKE